MKSYRPLSNVAKAVYQVLKKFLTSRLALRLNHILLLQISISSISSSIITIILLQISVYSSEIARIADLFRYDTYP